MISQGTDHVNYWRTFTKCKLQIDSKFSWPTISKLSWTVLFWNQNWVLLSMNVISRAILDIETLSNIRSFRQANFIQPVIIAAKFFTETKMYERGLDCWSWAVGKEYGVSAADVKNKYPSFQKNAWVQQQQSSSYRQSWREDRMKF